MELHPDYTPLFSTLFAMARWIVPALIFLGIAAGIAKGKEWF